MTLDGGGYEAGGVAPAAANGEPRTGAATDRALERIARDDPRYPGSLGVVEQPPAVLYARGDTGLLARRMVAIVGSRHPSAYGIRVAYEAAQAAARAGLVVVSGMARGLDSRAHRGALDAGGPTIAVLASGADVPYPAGNRELYLDIVARGLVVSEAEPGAWPFKGSFPWRNRIIAGLGECLLVVEGSLTSGTMITAGWAAKLGKQVFAVPGRIDEEMAQGPNHLIVTGATPYQGPGDVLERFGIKWEGVLAEERRQVTAQLDLMAAESGELLKAEARVFDVLGAAALHVDAIGARTALEAGTLLAALSSLELKGLAVQLPGKYFALAS